MILKKFLEDLTITLITIKNFISQNIKLGLKKFFFILKLIY